MTRRRSFPWGPSLSSASGAAVRPAPVNEHDLVPRALVRLPRNVDGIVRVAVGGVPQIEGVDFFLVGRLLVFERAIEPERPLRYLRRLVAATGMGTTRRTEKVDVWFGSRDDPDVVRDLPVERYP